MRKENKNKNINQMLATESVPMANQKKKVM